MPCTLFQLRNILECAGLNSVKSPTLSLYPTYMQRRESLSLSACFLPLFSSFYFLQLPGNVTIQKRHAIKEKLVGRGRTAGMCTPPPLFSFSSGAWDSFFSIAHCSCSGCSLLPSCVLFRWGLHHSVSLVWVCSGRNCFVARQSRAPPAAASRLSHPIVRAHIQTHTHKREREAEQQSK